MTGDPISQQYEAEARATVARLAMLDARDLANRAIVHANDLRKIGGNLAEAAADTFEKKAAEFRDLERAHAVAAGVTED